MVYFCIAVVVVCLFVSFSDIFNITIDGEAVTQTKFGPTKKMSTYLLAIIVSDYTHLGATQGHTVVTVTVLMLHFHQFNAGVPKLILNRSCSQKAS